MNMNYERFCFPVTLRCNLRCKLCAEHSPYYNRPYYPSLEELILQIDGLFRLTDSIGKFDITGGEPFLRKDLPQILQYLYDHYRGQIEKLRVTTNGTLLPPEGFEEAAKLWENDFFLIIDHYEVSQNAKKVSEIMEQAQIAHELRDYSGDLHCDGWVDYGDLTCKHSKEEARLVFQKCAVPKLGFFSCMVNGHIFPCARARLLYEKSILDITVDIFDEELSEVGKKARMQALLEEEVLEACRYCNGLCEDGERFRPAEQLKGKLPATQTSLDPGIWKQDYGKVMFYTQTYNNEKTIARTMESILAQTNDQYTYFVCNNGSTDKTDEIIRAYAKVNSRMVYVTCEKNDLLAAIMIPGHLFAHIPRNLDPYYCIVDGDDTLEPDFLQRVIDVIQTQEVDMIVPSYNRVQVDTLEVINKRRIPEDVIVSGAAKAHRFMEFRALLLCQWGKVYRYHKFKKMTNVLLYNCYLKLPKWFHQLDTVGVLSVYYQSNQVAFIAEPIYNYAISTQSTYGNYLPDRVKNDVLMFQIYHNFLDKYQDVDQLNYDFCYAIYLSLLYENLNSLFHTDKVSLEQKLSDLYDIMTEPETVNMLTLEFDSRLENLSDRKEFLDKIYAYVHALDRNEVRHESVERIMKTLNQYGEYHNQ